jgi:hypothetical protein
MVHQKHLGSSLPRPYPHHVRLTPQEGGWSRTVNEVYRWWDEHAGTDCWRTPSGFFFKRDENPHAFRE